MNTWYDELEQLISKILLKYGLLDIPRRRFLNEATVLLKEKIANKEFSKPLIVERIKTRYFLSMDSCTYLIKLVDYAQKVEFENRITIIARVSKNMDLIDTIKAINVHWRDEKEFDVIKTGLWEIATKYGLQIYPSFCGDQKNYLG